MMPRVFCQELFLLKPTENPASRKGLLRIASLKQGNWFAKFVICLGWFYLLRVPHPGVSWRLGRLRLS